MIYFFQIIISRALLFLFRYAEHKRYPETSSSSSRGDYHRERDRDRERRERRDRDRYGPLPPGAYYPPPPSGNGAELAYRSAYPIEGAAWSSRSEREYLEYRRGEYDRRPPPSANS